MSSGKSRRLQRAKQAAKRHRESKSGGKAAAPGTSTGHGGNPNHDARGRFAKGPSSGQAASPPPSRGAKATGPKKGKAPKRKAPRKGAKARLAEAKARVVAKEEGRAAGGRGGRAAHALLHGGAPRAPSPRSVGVDSSGPPRPRAIAGQFPKVQWRPNPGGQVRTIDEAVEIARRNGVRIPKDVAFFVDEFGYLNPTLTARGPEVSKLPGERVTWSDLVHAQTGKVPFLIRPDILQSDEAIVAVIAHEVHEIQGFRKIVGRRGSISFDEFIAHHAPDNPGNLHQQAWDVADALVRRMRGERP